MVMYIPSIKTQLDSIRETERKLLSTLGCSEQQQEKLPVYSDAPFGMGLRQYVSSSVVYLDSENLKTSEFLEMLGKVTLLGSTDERLSVQVSISCSQGIYRMQRVH